MTEESLRETNLNKFLEETGEPNICPFCGKSLMHVSDHLKLNRCPNFKATKKSNHTPVKPNLPLTSVDAEVDANSCPYCKKAIFHVDKHVIRCPKGPASRRRLNEIEKKFAKRRRLDRPSSEPAKKFSEYQLIVVENSEEAIAVTMPEIIVLFDGYSRMEGEVFRANCSCTLIKGRDGLNVIVDTMTCWDTNRLLEALEKQGVLPGEVSWVISTHGHSDHLGNNNLFLKAKHIVGSSCIHQSDEFFSHEFVKESYRIDEDIEVISTPGHTMSCVSVLVRGSNVAPDGVVAIVGDLFEKVEDIEHEFIWIGAGSESADLQRKNRSKVAEMSDWIVPGHGPMFEVTEQIKKKLKVEEKQ